MNTRLAASAAVSLALALVASLGACSTNAEEDGATNPSSEAAQSAPAVGAQSAEHAQSAQAPESGATPAQIEEENTDISPIAGEAWVSSAPAVDPVTTEKPMAFHDLRVGEHETFYRVVVEFTGEGTPGYVQSWADAPIEQGRGRRLPVEGASFLDLMISGTSMPIDDALAPLSYDGPSNLALGPLDVREDGTFEDTTHIVIGMDAPREFQIGFLEDPVRVVIDVKK